MVVKRIAAWMTLFFVGHWPLWLLPKETASEIILPYEVLLAICSFLFVVLILFPYTEADRSSRKEEESDGPSR